jgi:prepilin-type N-terminal cleavage/methylation domain-containing protein
MRRRESGFSLLELMIALAIVAFVLAAASTFFIGVVKQYKVQSKITESNIEGIIGLELLRQDLESLGFGLPWDLGTSTYTEPGPLQGTDPPRAVGSLDGATDNSDYLVIRSARVGIDNAAGKWTTLRAGPQVRIWGSEDDDLATTDHVIVLSPGGVNIPSRVLLTPTGGMIFGINGGGLSGYTPFDSIQTNIVYGIDSGTPLKRPFNRADYYIANNPTYPPPYVTPRHCATNTGVLVKAVRAHDTDGTRNVLPLLDCVADMQVIYGLDTDADPLTPLVPLDDLLGLTADAIRTQLKEIHVHILAQVGQRDRSYTYPYDNVTVGSEGFGRNFDFTSSSIDNFRNYRWKVYNIVVKPKNLAAN